MSCDKQPSHITILLFFFLAIISSCGPSRNLAYFSDLEKEGTVIEKIENSKEAKIQSDDLLGVLVTSLSPEANNLFNRGAMPVIGGTNATSAGGTYAQGNSFNESYLVDKNGDIDFPVLGKVKVAGLTKAEAKEKLTKLLEKYLKEPIVYIRFLNFRVTVIGEVNSPATFTIPTERVNIVEALGLAGDMTPYGNRDNVLIIREEEGQRILTRVNLNNKDVFKSPYFYLQQNDVVYVEPYKTLQAKTSNTEQTARIIQIGISLTSLLIVIVTQLAR